MRLWAVGAKWCFAVAARLTEVGPTPDYPLWTRRQRKADVGQRSM